MQTRLPEEFTATPTGAEADRILRNCVHCGFCNATCPTYQLLGDELDGPRGRIYLIKRMLEDGAAGTDTQRHLDRCLTCRACETTCPSGVEYGRLLDIGRARVEATVDRPRGERLLRRLLCAVLPYPGRIRAALAASRWFGALLPTALARAMPARVPGRVASDWPAARHARRVLILEGCIQSVTHAHINAAAARLLDRRGLSLIRIPDSACCGAVSHHLAQDAQTRGFLRRNIDAWWPEVERGVEAIVTSSSACSSMVKDYGHLLRDDPEYADKARRISELAGDITGVIARLGLEPRRPAGALRRIAFHAPCSLQHGLRAHTVVEELLRGAGFELTPVADAHLCCGAAGTYSILQAGLSEQLLANKLAALEAATPEIVASANIGCLIRLQGGTRTPVRHWVELIEEAYR
ncbi:MAG: glycolate oxidase subunit GlcF [Gammaproteobacteria bacterium]|nr:glycolate oxidase subunit GlcF [Gammaproteobacteria bacterium]